MGFRFSWKAARFYINSDYCRPADFDMSLEEAVKAPKFVDISHPEIRMGYQRKQ